MCLAYVLAGKLGLMLALPPGYASAIFPPAGIAMAAAFIAGRATLPWIFLGSLLLNLWAGYAFSHTISASSVIAAWLIATASTLQAAAGGTSLRYAVSRQSAFDQVRDVVLLLLIAPLTCLISATISVSGLTLIGTVNASGFAVTWFTWWIGDTLGAAVMTPIVLALASRPRSAWRGRVIIIVVPMLLALLTVATVFVRTSRWENEESLVEFHARSQRMADLVQTRFEEQEFLLEEIRVHLLNLPGASITRENFQRFVNQSLTRFPMVQAVVWAPHVARNERNLFEAQQRDHFAYRITEQNAELDLMTAGEHPDYYPVVYVEPFAPNRKLIGFDLGSNAERRFAIVRALKNNSTVASGPLPLIQTRSAQRNITLFLPVNLPMDADHPGLVAMALRVSDFMDNVLPDERSLFSVALTDIAAHEQIYGQLDASSHAGTYAQTLRYGGREYLLQTQPSALYLSQHRGWQSWTVAAVGFFGTGLIGALLLLGTGYTARVEANVIARTEDLARASKKNEIYLGILRESEAKLRGLYSLSPLGIALADMQGHFIEFNDAFKHICGYSSDEIKQLDYWTLTPSEYSADEQQQLELLRTQGHYGPFEKEYVRKDGRRIPLELNGILITGSDGQEYIWSIVEDITERKRAEIELREQKELLAAILENANVGVALVKDRVQIWANQGMAELFGYTLKEMDHVDTRIFYSSQEAYEELGRAAYPVLARGQRFSKDSTLQRKDGSDIDLHISGQAIQFGKLSEADTLWVFRDISERKATEKALAITRERLTFALQGAELAWLDRDLQNDRYIFGDGWVKLLGYTLEEMPTNRNEFRALINPDDALIASSSLKRHLDAETPSFEAELRMRHKDGHWVWISFRGMVVERNMEGKALRMSGTAMDITERKAMEQELKRLATTDPLTGAANRRLFLYKLELEFARVKRFGEATALLMLDIDHFKHINDTYGHATGDAVLQSFAELVRRNLRNIDVFGRLGGEEFAVLLPGTDMRGAHAFAERLRGEIAGSQIHTANAALAIAITVSIGVAPIGAEDSAASTVLALADTALYKAKENGRNRVESAPMQPPPN